MIQPRSYENCIICGKKLTTRASKELGIGPECKKTTLGVMLDDSDDTFYDGEDD